MKVIIEFCVDNAAFKHNDEINAVLDDAADKVKFMLGRHCHFPDRQEASSPGLRDSNGNTVGSVRLEEE